MKEFKLLEMTGWPIICETYGSWMISRFFDPEKTVQSQSRSCKQFGAFLYCPQSNFGDLLTVQIKVVKFKVSLSFSICMCDCVFWILLVCQMLEINTTKLKNDNHLFIYCTNIYLWRFRKQNCWSLKLQKTDLPPYETPALHWS